MNIKNKKLDIFILAGQSNAEGNGMYAQNEDREVREDCFEVIDSNPYGYNLDDPNNPFMVITLPIQCSLEVLKDRVSEEKPRGSFINSFVDLYKKSKYFDNSRTIVVIKSAVGGTALCKNEWGKGNYLYERLVDMTKYTLDLVEDARIVAFLWHQGEADAFEQPDLDLETKRNNYHRNFMNQINDFKTKFPGDYPVILGDMCDQWCHSGDMLLKTEAIEKAFRDCAKDIGNSFVVSSEGLASNAEDNGGDDTIHFSKKSLKELGRRYFEAFCEIKKENMKFDKSKKYIEQKIKELNLPYFSCVVKKEGHKIFSYSFEKEEKGNNLLTMYSMSKPITCVALMQLVQKGLISLDDEVSKYLPNFGNLKNINTGDKIKNSIKIWNLLSMSSGLDYNFRRKSVFDYTNTHKDASTVDVCSLLAKDGLLFEPGKGFQYSLSIDVIAAIIQKITGQRFSLYVKENVFDKLGMNHSTFAQDWELVKSCRSEYWPTNDFLNVEKGERVYKNFFPTTDFESGGAGLISTVEDYSLFADSIANQTNVLIDDKLADEIGKIRIQETPFNETVQEYSKSSEDYGYGLAVRVRKADSPEGIPAGEFGWDGAAGSYSLMDRKNHISIVIGLTIDNWPAYIKDLHIAIVRHLYKDIFNK